MICVCALKRRVETCFSSLFFPLLEELREVVGVLRQKDAVCTQSEHLCNIEFYIGLVFETLGDLLSLPIPEIELLSESRTF